MNTGVLTIENHGPLILSSNFWQTDAARAGKFYLSTNAGAFRLLIPRAHEAVLAEMRTACEVIVSRNPWPAERLADALEVLFEDGSDSPFALHLSLESADRVPLDEDQGRELVFTAWTTPRRGKPHKALERPAWYRRVAKLPCLEPR